MPKGLSNNSSAVFASHNWQYLSPGLHNRTLFQQGLHCPWLPIECYTQQWCPILPLHHTHSQIKTYFFRTFSNLIVTLKRSQPRFYFAILSWYQQIQPIWRFQNFWQTTLTTYILTMEVSSARCMRLLLKSVVIVRCHSGTICSLWDRRAFFLNFFPCLWISSLDLCSI